MALRMKCLVYLLCTVTNIVADLKELGVPARLDLHEEGGHGVGNLIPQRVKNGFPGAQWPKVLVEWLKTLEGKK